MQLIDMWTTERDELALIRGSRCLWWIDFFFFSIEFYQATNEKIILI